MTSHRGQIGDVELASAQPSADFEAAAIQALRAAKLSPGASVTGCVEVIRFRMEEAESDDGELRTDVPNID